MQNRSTLATLSREEIESVACSVRRKFENRELDASALLEMYRTYNPVPEPELFIERAMVIFPHLCCGLTSISIRNELGQGDVIQGTYDGQGHTFLLIGDNAIVDITADQFGGPKIYVGPLQTPWGLDRPTPYNHPPA